MNIGSNDFRIISEIVLDRSGIVLKEGKEYLVESRLDPVLKLKQLQNFTMLAALLREGASDLEELVVEALTTNETSFFRDVKPFDALREQILPELIERRAKERALNIWCVASSSGQEPYSLSMLLRDHFPQLASWNLTFHATDISSAMIKRCEEGLYTQLEVSRGLSADLLARYFDKVGAQWRVRPEIRRMVAFKTFNLKQPLPSIGPLDLVMMRNVLIYFDEDTKSRIINRICNQLRPGGILMLGAAEVARYPGLDQLSHSATRYFKKG